MSEHKSQASLGQALSHEWPLSLNLVTTGLFFAFGKAWLADLSSLGWVVFMMVWLFGIIMLSAFQVVHHAESIAVKLGEPLGTLVLTLAVTGIEVMMISAVMASGGGNATLVRDAMLATMMIVLNGMVGLSLLLGGLRYREQTYNLRGANAFLAVIVPLGVLDLVLPSFTTAVPGPVLSTAQAFFFSIMSVGLYAVFLAIQNVRHRDYFIHPGDGDDAGAHDVHEVRSTAYHTVLLFAYLLPIVFLSKKIAIPLNHTIDALRAPPALGGFLVSVLILSPESLGATRAALANQLQRSVNILLGSVLAAISLTIPAVLTIGYFTGQTIILGLEPVEMTMLLLTLAVSMLTFASARTNVLQGAVHLILFLAYLMLLFEH